MRRTQQPSLLTHPIEALAYRILMRRQKRHSQRQRSERLRARGSKELVTREDFAQAAEAFDRQNRYRNPYGAERSIYGRSAKTYLDDQWLAVLTGVRYTLGAEGKSGGGQMTVEKVNSSWEGLIADAEKRTGHTLRVSLEDPGAPSPEVLVLNGVEFQALTSGYDIDKVVVQEVFFTFESWELAESIDERRDSTPEVAERFAGVWEYTNA